MNTRTNFSAERNKAFAAQRGRGGGVLQVLLGIGVVVSSLLIYAASPWGQSTSARARQAQSAASVDSSEYSATAMKRIEEIQVGDVVLAKSDATGAIEPKRVTHVFRNTADHLRILEIRSQSTGVPQTIKTTDEHPFWVQKEGWVEARDLKKGNRLLQDDGNAAIVVSSGRESHPEGIAVYNLEAEGFHTYFVSANGARAPPVWVHNCSVFRKSPNSAKSLVLGEGMDAVKDAARGLRSEGINAKWYQAWGKNFPTNRPMTSTELEAALARNERWIRQKVKEGYQFYDIGLDPTRSVRSPFYGLEQRILKELDVETIPLPR